MENIGIKISPDPEVVKVTIDGIMQIFSSKVDNETMRTALQVLGKCASADYNTVSNCTVNMGGFETDGNFGVDDDNLEGSE